MSTAGSAGAQTSAEQVWRDALDALEADVAEAEKLVLLVQAQVGDVPAPELALPVAQLPPAPLPASLAPRAAALLTRQQQAVDAVTSTMAGIRRQQRRTTQLAAQLDQRPDSRPVYVDRVG